MESNKREGLADVALASQREGKQSREKRHRHCSKESSAPLTAPDSAFAAASTATPVMTRAVASKRIDVVVRGVLESAVCHGPDTLFARTYWVYGTDWAPLTSVPAAEEAITASPLVKPMERQMNSEVITQLSWRSNDPFARFTWAAPFECALRGTNPHGWPQLVVTLHTVSHLVPTNRPPRSGSASGSGEKCLSYSRCFIPLRSGTHRKQLPLLQLVPNTRKQAWISWWTGECLELRDPAFLCSCEDRGVLCAKPLPGLISLSLSVMVNGFTECGIEP
ncbi:B9 protein domain 1 [Trypanosoma rangeli]|uniref:B9 domain-containing protein 1 n=1 Tax=Trypanosoma rangeli TaxID=5698 RepID=A0A422P116_TRYRA|nr:B9 protein domain 1 [Trypanosoma rangeli]RNF11391.1 B9 protein domain 1 [Trypanosoma rangeli]|eukprot:RNF11391.1 B9 protein domain 1 [Trypanosoma rangeli]